MEVIPASAVFPVSLALAFLLGFGARQVKLPPMLGFLAAGFVLKSIGLSSGETIQRIADMGVTLLLFTIGLKLKLKNLARPEVWAGASAHAVITILFLTLCLMGLGAGGIAIFRGMNFPSALLVAFALSFSSTVFAAKVLEEKGEMSGLHGRTAIGILIMQDVFAVIFLTASSGKLPSPWAFALVGLILVRPALGYFLDRCGHGELLPLFGLFSALVVGLKVFELVGLKPDLGALVFGMLLANHPRASELADTLFSFKEVFLVGFFLDVGLSGLPGPAGFLVAALLVLALPIKTFLYFLLLTRFKLRAHSSFMASLSLANYSEFGLIVGSIAASKAWIGSEWLVIIAIALSVSFVIAAPLNTQAHRLFARYQEGMQRFETTRTHPEEEPIDIGDAQIAILGMGRIGTGAYDYLRERYGEVIVGIDNNSDKVAEHRRTGRNVFLGDVTDPTFWRRVARKPGQIRMLLLAMPEHQSNRFVLELLKTAGYPGFIAALAQFKDEVEALKLAGVHAAFDAFSESGAGFAAHADDHYRSSKGIG
jgi:glutathione-regulated potassium-efflux system ancillary protein KefC